MAENIKYINADELYINLDTMKNPDSEFATDDYIDGFSDGISAAIKELEAFPTADVQPVAHSKWEISSDGYYPYCKMCNARPENGKITNYCPNCGARMDGNKVE